jgi:hypothetical protein
MNMHPEDLGTPVDPSWWRSYLERVLIAGGIGLMGVAKETSRN